MVNWDSFQAGFRMLMRGDKFAGVIWDPWWRERKSGERRKGHAVVSARELTRWGIETSIVVPGAFTGGTNHFAHSGRPADTQRVAEYDNGPYKNFADDVMKGFASIVPDRVI